MYEVDRGALGRLRSEPVELQEQLRRSVRRPTTPTDLAPVRRRREKLTQRIGREERALEEAVRSLGNETDPAEQQVSSWP